MSRESIYALIAAERERQDAQWGEWATSGDRLDHAEKLVVLMTEVGEVAEAVALMIDGGRFIRPGHSENLAEELVQVAAVGVAWLEAIEREQGGPL